jgi:NAD(P)H-nitrite reductase large subunit
MKRIVVIGNSAAGIAAVEAIREKDKTSPILVISREPYMPYRRNQLLDFVEGKIKEKDLYFRSQDFYKNNAIELMLEKEVVELNLNKKKVIFKERDFVEFDELLLTTGSSVKLPLMKGVQKDGVVAFHGLRDAKFLIENLPLAHTVVIVGSDAVSLELARIIAVKKIETKFFGILNEPLEGVDVVSDNSVMEILGDSDAKAVRLSNGKVIGASLVIFSSPSAPNIGFLKDTDVKTNHGIVVDEHFCTNIPFVYAAGDVCEFSGRVRNVDWQSAVQEGQMVGGFLCQI